MPTSTPPSDAFPTAYNVALHAARDLTLAPDERARVIDLFVQVLLIWPKRWNESIEREMLLTRLHHDHRVELEALH